MADQRPRCSETRKDGQPCTAPAIREGKCAGHLKLGLASNPEAARAAQQASLEVRQAKAAQRAMTFQDHLAAELQKDAEKYVAAMRKAASDGDWRAYEAWTTRVHGKPVERVETTVNSLDPSELSSVQRAELRRQLVAEHPELLELVPARERVTKSV